MLDTKNIFAFLYAELNSHIYQKILKNYSSDLTEYSFDKRLGIQISLLKS